MPVELLSSGAILVDDALHEQAADVAAVARDHTASRLFVELENGRRIEVGAELAGFFVAVLERLTQGAVSVTTLPDELTTTVAAEMIGISRPTLMKLVAAGEIPSTRVRSHSRFATRDVLAYRAARDARRMAAFEALRAVDDEIDELKRRGN